METPLRWWSVGVPAAAGAVLLALAALSARGEGAEAGAWLDEGARSGAEDAARLFASLSAHLQASGGDRRFAERIPADDDVVAELLADAAWVQRAGRKEIPRLVRFDVHGVEPVALGVVEVKAREFWVTSSSEGSAHSVRSDVVLVRYALRRDAARWRVAYWTVEPEAEAALLEVPR